MKKSRTNTSETKQAISEVRFVRVPKVPLWVPSVVIILACWALFATLIALEDEWVWGSDINYARGYCRHQAGSEVLRVKATSSTNEHSFKCFSGTEVTVSWDPTE